MANARRLVSGERPPVHAQIGTRAEDDSIGVRADRLGEMKAFSDALDQNALGDQRPWCFARGGDSLCPFR